MEAEQREVKRGRGHPRLYASADDMQVKIDKYFDELPGKTETYYNTRTGIPTIVQTPAYYGRLLLELGMTYDIAGPYERGEYDFEGSCYSACLAHARMRCEAEVAEGGAKGRYTERIVMAILMRHHGFTDKQEINTTTTTINLIASPDEAATLLAGMAGLLQAVGRQQERIAEPVIDAPSEPI